MVVIIRRAVLPHKTKLPRRNLSAVTHLCPTWTNKERNYRNRMNKSFILIPLLALTACVNQGGNNQNVEKKTISQYTKTTNASFDGRNASFTVDGKSVTLVNGASEIPIENSSAKISTRYLGNQAKGDLNGDGLEDHAFLITQTTGGSGTFYYVVVALKNSDGYKTTNAFFIGDRIKPQLIEIRSDVKELHVNYANTKQNEPMTAKPTEEKVLLLKVTQNGVLKGLMK